MPDPTPYDALLLVSFGGPEKPEDVVPFLENVTKGRGIPRERLEEVGEHYFRFGGRSPLNDLNREFLAAVREDFKGAGLDLPVYWGNRNWDPYLTEAVEEMRGDGVRRALCLLTSAYSSYSGCRQYRENLADAVGDHERHPPGPDPALLQPPGLRGDHGRRDAQRAQPAAGRLAQRGPPPLRHPLDPRHDERGQRCRGRPRHRPGRPRLRPAAPERRRPGGRAAAQPDRPPVPRRADLLLALRPAERALARARRR